MNPWRFVEAHFAGKLPLPGQALTVEGLPETLQPLAVAVLSRLVEGPVLLLTPDGEAADRAAIQARWHLQSAGEDPDGVARFPTLDVEPYRGLSPHPRLLEERCETLWRLLDGGVRVLVTTPATLLDRLPSPDDFLGRVLEIRVNRDYSLPDLRARLARMGYSAEDPVTEVGEFAVRGGMMDVFPPGAANPYRVDFFGDCVESVRAFDPETQRSLGAVERVTLLPLTHFPVGEVSPEALLLPLERRFADPGFLPALTEIRDQLEAGAFPAGGEFLLGLAARQDSSLLDYLDRVPGLVLDLAGTAAEDLEKTRETLDREYAAALERGQPALEPDAHTHPPVGVAGRLAAAPLVRFPTFADGAESPVSLRGTATSSFLGDFGGLVRYLAGTKEHVLFVLSSEGRCARIHHLLEEYEVPHAWKAGFRWEEMDLSGGRRVVIAQGPLERGFRLPGASLAVLGSYDIFPRTAPVRREAPRSSRASAFFSDFRELKPGDYVVHLDHGVGVFRGLEKIAAAGVEQEFALLEYADRARVYIPVERMDLIQKYTGAEGAPPAVDRLGGTAWKKSRAKIKKAVREMADELIKLYARRTVAEGHAFPPDDHWMREFEDMFEHEPTADQLRAVTEIKRDMESPRPMDRLLCGDVGYGKTEVAMRAVFKAVSAGRQVAVLTPTTVLAFQHYNTFQSRFASFPFRIELVSRFRRPEQVRETLKDLAAGKVDVVIGTHRLLSKDVAFHDLGLLVVDEEQRFGVTHKERIKTLRTEVDVLTLSATPIPRTLYMTLSGIRDVSVIETPPKDRLSIQTQVMKHSDDAVAEAIARELARGGQVYFVHNRVESIFARADRVRQLVPEARIGVAHGQMAEKELEKVILDFMLHRFDVLVSTTIIENGIDIPLVNTIVVNKAHMFGLAQLYQLRGRVGRSNRRAYALLLVPTFDELSETARRRLAAIRDFTELGSGFRLAALDLEIRGAGNVLGAEQHGHMMTVGFETYCRLMEEAVKELRGEAYVAPEALNIQLQVRLRIPETYIAQEGLRLQLYKRIASLGDEASIADLQAEVRDRFGPFPEVVEWLFDYARLKARAMRMNIPAIVRRQDTFRIQLSRDSTVNPEAIVRKVQAGEPLTFSPEGVLSATLPFSTVPEMFDALGRLLDDLSSTSA